ncbi:MAG: vWA domain-containing protein [Hyphomicrobiaceae bacterium]
MSIIFGLLAVPFVSFAGLSIDFAAASREKSKIHAALDAAALAAGRAFQVSCSVAEAKAAASLYFERQTGYNLSVNSVDEGTFVLTVGSSENVPTSFMGVLGQQYDALTVNALSRAQLVQEMQDEEVEVSMMLDVTGSMSGQRITDLKAAASDLVNILVQDGEDEVRIALAPFSHAVNVGPYFNAMTNQSPTGGNTCVVERHGSNRYKPKKPSAGNGYFEVFPASGSYWTCPNAEMIPLSSDKQMLLDAIDDLPTHGNTAGHLGTAWAWYLVSHKWASMFPSDRAPDSSMTGAKKIAVLMSDGRYNKEWNGSDTGDDSDEQARKLCNKMKNNNNQIIVYAVGFELSEGSTAYNRLQECASSSAHFFPAFDGDELKAAFRTIAFSIAQLRLVE